MDCVITSWCHEFEISHLDWRNRWAEITSYWYEHTQYSRIDRVADRPGNMRSTFDSHSNVNINFHFFFVRCVCCFNCWLLSLKCALVFNWLGLHHRGNDFATQNHTQSNPTAVWPNASPLRAWNSQLKIWGIRMKQPQNKKKKNEKDKLIIRKIAVSCVRTW